MRTRTFEITMSDGCIVRVEAESICEAHELAMSVRPHAIPRHWECLDSRFNAEWERELAIAERESVLA